MRVIASYQPISVQNAQIVFDHYIIFHQLITLFIAEHTKMFQIVTSLKQKSLTLGVTNDEEKITRKLKRYTFDLIPNLQQK